MNQTAYRVVAPLFEKLKAASRVVVAVDDSARLAMLRCVLVVGTLAGILLSLPLWTADRPFPLLPISSWFPSVPAPWDKWFLAVWLVSLVLSLSFPRLGTIGFLSGAAFLCLADQNRLQPWLYLYAVMLFFTLFSRPIALTGARVALSGVYFWSGVMKLTPAFFREIAPWFVAPFASGLPAPLQQTLQFGPRLVPFIEILIGIGLWLPHCRRPAVWGSLLVHAGALICLGPFGRNHNIVIWPWNAVMPILAWVLFYSKSDRFVESLRLLRRSPAVSAVILLFCVMPVFSWIGWWDSYLSFSLYSGNGTVAAIHVSETFRQQLPDDVRRFVQPLKARPCLPRLEGTYLLDHLAWANAALGAPGLPEPRAFHSMAQYLMRYQPSHQAEVSMLIKPVRGPILYYEGERCRGIVLPEPAPVERVAASIATR